MRIEIKSRTNPRLQELLKHKHEYFFFEGEKLVADLLRRNIPFTMLIYTDSWDRGKNGLNDGNDHTEEWLVSDRVMKKISDLDHPPPIVAVVESLYREFSWGKKSWLAAFDSVQDPANMGSIFRCASAFGMEALLFCGECVRPNHPKLIRAAQTSLFDLQFRYFSNLDEVLQKAQEHGYSIYLTTSHPPRTPRSLDSLHPPALLVFGSEGRGIRRELLDRYPLISIAQDPRLESLNVSVAACIFFHELYRLGKK